MKLPAYSRTAAALHWAHAGLIIALLGVGLTMVELPKGAERSAAYALHKSMGLLALLAVGIRFAWRRHCPPPRHPGLNELEQRMAAATHGFLYLLLALVPVSGFAAVCFTPYPLAFFGLPIPKPGWPDPGLNALFGFCHKATLAALGIALCLHLGAVLRHLWLRDGTLGRMFPRGKTPEQKFETETASAGL